MGWDPLLYIAEIDGKLGWFPALFPTQGEGTGDDDEEEDTVSILTIVSWKEKPQYTHMDIMGCIIVALFSLRTPQNYKPWLGLQIFPTFSLHWLILGLLGSVLAGSQQSSVQVSVSPQSHCSPLSTILFPHIGSSALIKQVPSCLERCLFMFCLMLSLLQTENWSLLGSMPDVALSNMM